jgi:hypothetical protein
MNLEENIRRAEIMSKYKKGDVLYKVRSIIAIDTYTVLCEFPNNGNYIILIDKTTQEPVRVYWEHLKYYLPTEVEALQIQQKYLEDELTFIKNKLTVLQEESK